MRAFVILLSLFVIVPFVELVLLRWLADATSWQFAVLVVLVTGIGGSALARWQGIGVWRKLQTQLAGGELPGKTLVDGMLILFAGAFLITPGILTDILGFLLLIPPSRALVRRLLMRSFERRMQASYVRFRFERDRTFDRASNGDSSVIDGEASPVEPPFDE